MKQAHGLALLLRYWDAYRAGISPRQIAFGAGSPRPRLKNEDGNFDLGRIVLGAGVRLWAHKGGSIRIGDGTRIDERAEIIGWQNVSIGARCYVGIDAMILDTDLHGIGDKPVNNRPVHIADDAYIGCRSIILKGVTVHSGAVIYPGSIVTHDVPQGAEIRPQLAKESR